MGQICGNLITVTLPTGYNTPAGSPNVNAEKFPVLRFGDKFSLPSAIDIATTSATVFANKLGVARVTDLTSDADVLTTGAPSVLVGP